MKQKHAPHEYSAEQREAIVDHVCEQIVQKRSLFKVLAEDEGMPSYAQFMKWQRESESIQERVAHAREDALEAIIEEIIEIADDSGHDPYIKWVDKKPYAAIDGPSVKRAKLMIDAREKAAQMLAPRRFSVQRMDVTTAGKPINSETNTTLVEQRVASIIMLARDRADEMKQLKQIMD